MANVEVNVVEQAAAGQFATFGGMRWASAGFKLVIFPTFILFALVFRLLSSARSRRSPPARKFLTKDVQRQLVQFLHDYNVPGLSVSIIRSTDDAEFEFGNWGKMNEDGELPSSKVFSNCCDRG